jgi:LysM repeat protein
MGCQLCAGRKATRSGSAVALAWLDHFSMKTSIVVLALVAVAGCATRSTTGLSLYPTTPAERELALAHSVPTNVPFGSVYEVRIYVVQSGDTVAKILEWFDLTQEQLSALNGGSPYRHIRAGERIVVFERTSPTRETGWK